MATGPGNIAPGSYEPQGLTQEQRQWLFNYFGNQGNAPVGYGGQGMEGPRGDIATGVAYAQQLEQSQAAAQKAIEPAITTLKEAQGKIAPIYAAKEEAVRGEIEPTRQRYENLLQQVVANQQKSETAQTLTTSRELGRRGIAAGSGLLEQELVNAINPIREYYTGQTKDVGFEREEKLRGLQNLIGELGIGRSQQEIELMNTIAQIQAGAGTGGIQSALQMYGLTQQSRESQLDRDLQERLAAAKETTAAPEYKFADVLGGGYIYDPYSGQVVNTLKDLRGQLGGDNGW